MTIKIVTPYKTIQQDILAACADAINKRTKGKIKQAEQKIKEVVKQELSRDSVLSSLVSSDGVLRRELGLSDATPVYTLINTIVDSIKPHFPHVSICFSPNFQSRLA